METLSFAFGVLSMIGLLFVIAIVIGAVKVIKQGKRIEELQDKLRGTHEEINRRFEETHRYFHQRIDDTHRTIEENLRNIHNLIDKNYTESISYTDSRLDKLEQKLTSTINAKQTLKA